MPENNQSKTDFDPGRADEWLARCSLPVRVEEFSTVVRAPFGRARVLLLGGKPAYLIPGDLAHACWVGLCPGELVCIRVVRRAGRLPLVGSVDALDGSVSLISQAVWADGPQKASGPAAVTHCNTSARRLHRRDRE